MFFEPLLNNWNNQAEAVFDSFLNYPIDGGAFPLNLPDIVTAQQDNPTVTSYLLNAPKQFKLVNYNGNTIICQRASNGQWKIVLPESLTEPAIKWYHALTAHGGSSRIRDSIGAFFWCSKLRESVEHYVSICDACQRYKDVGRGQGQLPPRNETAIPWSDVAVDLIGPWKVNNGGRELVIKALTVIDVCTCLNKIVQIDNGTS